MVESGEAGEKLVATNRKARHEFFILDTLEAGIVLKGTEVKSLREGKANVSESYAHIRNDEVWLAGMHISPYKQGSFANVDPLRERKLLLHKREIAKLAAKTLQKGFTLIPLKLYFKKNVAKVQIGVAQGKKAHDQRHDIARRESEREIRRKYAR